jgi:hypothetical protein
MQKLLTVKIILALLAFPISSFSGQRMVTDATGQEVKLANRVEQAICSGAGCLRLLTYLQAQHLKGRGYFRCRRGGKSQSGNGSGRKRVTC